MPQQGAELFIEGKREEILGIDNDDDEVRYLSDLTAYLLDVLYHTSKPLSSKKCMTAERK